MITEELKKLYIAHTGHEPEQIDELPSSGSNRRYFRLIGSPTLIGVSGESVEENRAFLYMAEHFRQKGLPVPQVFIRSEDDIYYLQEDLGDSLLFNAIEKGRKTSVFGEEEKQLLRKTIRLLPAVQFAGADGMDFSYCYPQAEFNSRSILWDLNYFKYCFLKDFLIRKESNLCSSHLRLTFSVNSEFIAYFTTLITLFINLSFVGNLYFQPLRKSINNR